MAATGSPAPVAPTIDSDLAGASSGPLADPGAWAVTAFATTSFMLGLYNTHLIGQGSLPIVFPVAFFFGGMIQILVGILEVGRGNVFGAVVFGTYGPFWVIYAAIQTWFAKMASPASSVDAGVALFLAMFAVLTFFFLPGLAQDRPGARGHIRAHLPRPHPAGDRCPERRDRLDQDRRVGGDHLCGAGLVSRRGRHHQLHLRTTGAVGGQDHRVALPRRESQSDVHHDEVVCRAP